MRILLVAATPFEVEPFVLSHPGIEILITGVGVPATLFHLHERVLSVGYELIIQAGIGGSFIDTLALGTVVTIGSDCFADIGMEEKGSFTPIAASALANKNEYPYKNGRLLNTNPLLNRLPFQVVDAVTVNKVSDNLLQREQIIQHFQPTIESMEGAALHYVCLQKSIPFLQVRAISNMVGVRDKSQWKMKASIEMLNLALNDIITFINSF